MRLKDRLNEANAKAREQWNEGKDEREEARQRILSAEADLASARAKREDEAQDRRGFVSRNKGKIAGAIVGVLVLGPLFGGADDASKPVDPAPAEQEHVQEEQVTEAPADATEAAPDWITRHEAEYPGATEAYLAVVDEVPFDLSDKENVVMQYEEAVLTTFDCEELSSWGQIMLGYHEVALEQHNLRIAETATNAMILLDAHMTAQGCYE